MDGRRVADGMGPEERAAVEAALAHNRTPEARAARERAREATREASPAHAPRGDPVRDLRPEAGRSGFVHVVSNRIRDGYQLQVYVDYERGEGGRLRLRESVPYRCRWRKAGDEGWCVSPERFGSEDAAGAAASRGVRATEMADVPCADLDPRPER
jgi:hypothetical protein